MLFALPCSNSFESKFASLSVQRAVFVKQSLVETWTPNPMPRSEKQNDRYKNPDNDPRGPWKPGDLSARNYYSKGTYSITCPSGRIISGPPTGRYWVYSEQKLWELNDDNRIWWGPDKNEVPAVKRFLSEAKQGVVPQTLWTYDEVGHTQDAKKELLSILDFGSSEDVFTTAIHPAAPATNATATAVLIPVPFITFTHPH